MTDLSVKGISKSFPGVQALSDVDLTAESGEVVGILGINGAGKSTLMSILVGLTQADSGEIRLDGEIIAPANPAEAVELGIALVHQEPAISPNLSVLENLFAVGFPNRGGLLDRSTMRERASAEMGRMGVDLDLDAPGASLSQGQRQLVEIARALLTKPRVVILDEPTSSLDETEKRTLFTLLGELRDSGVVVLYITHFIEEVFTVCDRVVVLRDGFLVGKVATEDSTQDEVVRLIVGEEVEERTREARPAGRVALRVKSLRLVDADYDWSFELAEGEIVGLWGLLGSGRSELLRSMIGLHPTSSAHLETSDPEGTMTKVSPLTFFRSAGYVPEDRHRQGLALNLSTRFNLVISSLGLMSKLGWISGGSERAIVADAIRKGGVKVANADRPVRNLSGGNQQKVVLNRHIIREPRFWLLDEPTRGLDIGARGDVHDVISGLADKGASVLMVTSDIDEMRALTDRVLVISRDGELIDTEMGADKEELMRIAQSSRQHGSGGTK